MTDYDAIEVIVPGDPPTKGRPRFGNGRTYTPSGTVAAETAFAWAVKAVAPGLRADPDGQYRIWARFYQKTFHRRDLDNMLKLVSDACNGIIWTDDAQVVSIDAELERGASEPRSHVVFSKLLPRNERPMGTCALCGTPFRLYPSQAERTACSAACASRLRFGVDLRPPVACDQCSTPFSRRTSSQRFCSEDCRRAWLRGRTRVAAIVKACEECGGVMPNQRASRCRACWRLSLGRAS